MPTSGLFPEARRRHGPDEPSCRSQHEGIFDCVQRHAALWCMLGRQHSIRIGGFIAARAGSRTIGIQKPAAHSRAAPRRLTLRPAQRRAVDGHGVALVAQSAEKSVDQVLVPEKGGPLVVAQVGGDDGRMAPIALLHQLEEDVRLLGLEIEVAHLVDHQDIETREVLEQPAGRAVGERGVHLVEEILGFDEGSWQRWPFCKALKAARRPVRFCQRQWGRSTPGSRAWRRSRVR